MTQTPSRTSLADAGPFAHRTVAEVAAAYRSGEDTPTRVVEQAMTAAATVGERLNAFVTLDESALDQAQRAADELAAGLDRGPLHGVPVAVKDLIDTAGLRTTMGARHFADHVPTRDADVVADLRQAGAVIIGKTVTHEYAYGPTGDRSATGATRNPHDLARMSGGSSAGSAAAVGAGIVPIALGTDTGGSVRIPAALCGVTGLRPTSGTLSSAGVFPLADSFDTVGPLARTVDDLGVAWSVLSGRPGTAPAGVRGLRIGRVRGYADRVATPVAAGVDEAAEILASSGAAVVDIPLSEVEGAWAAYADVQGPEAYAVHAERIETAASLFDPEVLERLRAGGEVPGWRYVAATRARAGLHAGILAAMRGIDVLLMATVPIAPPLVGERDGDFGGGWTNARLALLSMTAPWGVVGMPALSVPVSPDDGLPRAAQLIGRRGDEALLLSVAATLV